MRLKDLHEKLEGKTAVFTFGRMNPPTIGHEKLLNKLKNVAGRSSADWFVYLSSSQDAKKNPLPFDRKIHYARKMFGRDVNARTFPKEPTALHAASSLFSKGYKKLVMVVGSDRVNDFGKLLKQYNNQDKPHGFYNFDSIDVVSAGERDPDAEGVSGMSASKLRGFAVQGKFDEFAKGLPGLNDKDAKSLFNEIRKGLKLQAISEKIKVQKEIIPEKVTMKSSTFRNVFKREKISEDIMDVLKKKSEVSGISLQILKSIYEKAIKQYRLGHEIGEVKEQYAIQKVNVHLLENKNLDDADEKFNEWMNMQELDASTYHRASAKMADSDKPNKSGRALELRLKGNRKDRKDLEKSWKKGFAKGKSYSQMAKQGGLSYREEAPPGREHQVKSLKKKVGTDKAYAFAWAQHNKHGLPDKKEEVELTEWEFDPNTLLQQLGGNKFMAMTGAKNLMVDKKEKSLHMRIGKNSKGINHVKITLMPDDTYKMDFGKIRKMDYKVVRSVTGVYAEALQDVFTEVTGMYTSL